MSLPTTPPDDSVFDDTYTGGHVLQFPSSPSSQVTTGPILQDKAPLQWAQRFLDDEFYHGDHYRLVRYRGEWYMWEMGVWTLTSGELIEGFAYRWASTQSIGKIEENKEFRPNRAKIGDLIAALRALVGVSDKLEMPCLLGRLDLDPKLAISVSNGIVDLRHETKLLHPTPLFFTCNRVEYAYNPNAGEAKQWQAFLESVWPINTKRSQRAVLQELFGYLLTADTRCQKAFMVLGPPRGGRGTIARVIKEIVGSGSYTAPSVSDLEKDFALETLIDKRVALVPDARFSAKSDKAAVAEKLLSITGEDTQNINRKNKSYWIGRLYCRVVLMSNLIPAFEDSSGALVSRMIILPMQNSFLGREDTGLEAKILAELPAIFLWAVRGLARLRKNDWRFTAVPDADDIRADMLSISSPISDFAAEVVEAGDDYTVVKTELYKEWRTWCTNNGLEHPGSAAMFSQKLKSLFPTIGTGMRLGSGSARGPRLYSGIRMRVRA